ncbi:SprT family zinc-dependent metalloprotease [Shewanella sp. Isolate8]|uniref:SprT family zinc-dependent metalloprotease n=1 Tax=Shewanella sp. Isolate8 TaxID=2908529 RepID=UPI001EFC5932|nr:SprT family zinc-dependent metalloprotease [Shewanella sp. Isolate8]MCG9745194.1 SprT family zinc-dependent metalloprotease [Shewanella sp. Isolate8]
MTLSPNMFRPLQSLFRSKAQDTQAPKSKVAKSDLNAHQQRIVAAVESCYQTAEQKLGRSFPRPEVNFKLRGKSAGTAHLQLNKLRFNPVLLEENPEEFVDQVVPHEICHLLAYRLFGRVKPHGKEWQALMINLYGLTPRTTHSLNTASVAGQTFDYACRCGVVPLSIRRHNKVQRQQTQYRCRRCKKTLSRVHDQP